MTTVKQASAAYSAGNEMASTLILANIALYGGEEAGLVVWARLIQAKAQPTVKGPLFPAATRRAA